MNLDKFKSTVIFYLVFALIYSNPIYARKIRNINMIESKVESVRSKKDPAIAVVKKPDTIKKRVGFFCGTFNPLHVGHIALIQNAKEKFNLDEIAFVISETHVENKQADISVSKRLQMLKSFAQDKPWVSVIYSNTGLFRGIIQPIKELYKDSEIYFAMGYDNLLMFEKYNTSKQIESIFNVINFIVASRFKEEAKNIECNIKDSNLQRFSKQISLLHLPKQFADLSSSLIRKLVKEGEIDKAISLVPEEIKQDVLNLYKDN